jgi:phosphoadenosine phosphosulfate reductase
VNDAARELDATIVALPADAPKVTLSAKQFAADAGYSKQVNDWLASVDAATRVRWALDHLPGPHALSSSFGAQAAVSLHLVTRADPKIPVIVVDTGYLFPETYRFIDTLGQQLSLNTKVFSSEQSTAWFEARHGKL